MAVQGAVAKKYGKLRSERVAENPRVILQPMDADQEWLCPDVTAQKAECRIQNVVPMQIRPRRKMPVRIGLVLTTEFWFLSNALTIK